MCTALLTLSGTDIELQEDRANVEEIVRKLLITIQSSTSWVAVLLLSDIIMLPWKRENLDGSIACLSVNK